jgi:hypothetical protein
MPPVTLASVYRPVKSVTWINVSFHVAKIWHTANKSPVTFCGPSWTAPFWPYCSYAVSYFFFPFYATFYVFYTAFSPVAFVFYTAFYVVCFSAFYTFYGFAYFGAFATSAIEYLING